jgi:truncated hemoglobin YjbI
MIITMILKFTTLWVKVLEKTIDNLDPNREAKQEIKDKMSELQRHMETIRNLKNKQGV